MGTPVTAMLLPIALLFLTYQAKGSPTLVEFINSVLSIIGAKYVPPESQKEETVVVTRQSSCRDCSRQGRFAFGIFTKTTTVAPPLPCCPGTSSCAKCGIERARRIIGGVETVAGVYPWIAALEYNGVIGGCSGTVVSSKWVITAAHCITSDGPTHAHLGLHDISDAKDTNREEVSVSVVSVGQTARWVHPDYNPSTFNNDIALLKFDVERAVERWTPACLPASSADYVGQTAKVYGWGKTNPCGSTLASKLMEAEMTVISDADCAAGSGLLPCSNNPVNVSWSGRITPQMLCAYATWKGSCQGDSGGPLTVKDGGQHHLAGVVSWAVTGCVADGLASVFAEVAKLRSWVDLIMAANGGIGTTC